MEKSQSANSARRFRYCKKFDLLPQLKICLYAPSMTQHKGVEQSQVAVKYDFKTEVAHFVESFYIHCRVEKQYAPESQAKVKECFDSWLLKHFGHFKLEEIKPSHLLQFRESMAARNLSIARQYSLLMTLKLFLKFCRSVLEMPCLDPDAIRLPRRAVPKVEYLTNQEIQAMRDCANASHCMGLRLRALFETLLATGMRISEALSLDRNSIDENTRQVVITGKGGKRRTVFFSEEALRWIGRYLAVRRDAHLALFATTGDLPQRWTRGDIPRYLRALGRAAGVKKRVTPHLLRHTFCTNLRNNGADISLIKDLAGHQDIHTTARYYLGSDTRILKEAVAQYLNYSADTANDLSGPA
jgi:integrase/recombinase XerD